MKKLHLFILALFCVTALHAADRIAVAEIMTRGNIDAAGLAGLADQIEAKLGGNYEVISRTALQAMLKEVAFQTESGLADSAGQLAELGRVHGVKYLLVTSVAQIGSRMGMTLMVVDCSTGKVDPKRHISLDAPDLNGLVRRLDWALDKIGLLARPGETAARKQLAVFPVQVAPGIAPASGTSFETKLSEFLLKSGSFELLGRDTLQAVAAESALADAALAAPGQQIKTGALAVGDWLITLMPIMFVAPTAGLISGFDSYRGFIIPIIVIVLVTTPLTMVVTGKTAEGLMRVEERKRKERRHNDK